MTLDQTTVAAGIPPEVLEALNRIYPERSPDPRDPHQEIIIAAAQRAVIREINSWVAAYQKKAGNRVLS